MAEKERERADGPPRPPLAPSRRVCSRGRLFARLHPPNSVSPPTTASFLGPPECGASKAPVTATNFMGRSSSSAALVAAAPLTAAGGAVAAAAAPTTKPGGGGGMRGVVFVYVKGQER